MWGLPGVRKSPRKGDVGMIFKKLTSTSKGKPATRERHGGSAVPEQRTLSTTWDSFRTRLNKRPRDRGSLM